ncbi:alpha/beta hydrolase [Aquimarina intermedia]|uniref:Esterase/lipase n=1 Tax=Aquimarina intermedia TaxID=350814 RepID=A0A5S5C704_9FLAO|nr:alpha/beta hydrolase [Aquimarina intermedia]TYP75211.1 esterase/lipase [Aquimarina intermedia]
MTEKQNKKNVPVQALLVPKHILKIGSTLNRLSPFLASRFAARLFLTPFSYKMPEREKRMFDNSKRELIKIPAIRREVMIYTYGNSDKKILLAHGWSGTGTQLAMLAAKLLEHGYSTVSFDAPAHGHSPGKRTMMPHFIETILHLYNSHGPFEAAVGHSLGGMSLLKATSDGLPINKLVIIGTANSVTAITQNFAKNMQLSKEVSVLLKQYFDKKFGEDLDAYSGAVSAEGVTIPTLVVHDKHDVDVHHSCAYEIADKLKKGTLLLTENLGHRKILGDENVIKDITSFIME